MKALLFVLCFSANASCGGALTRHDFANFARDFAACEGPSAASDYLAVANAIHDGGDGWLQAIADVTDCAIVGAVGAHRDHMDELEAQRASAALQFMHVRSKS